MPFFSRKVKQKKRTPKFLIDNFPNFLTLAVSHLKKAIAYKANLAYDEPPPWYTPARHNLGAVLLAAGRPAEAQKVYEDDLKKYPENGWSLFGLQQSLLAQNKTAEADAVKKRLAQAWAGADVTLVASRF